MSPEDAKSTTIKILPNGDIVTLYNDDDQVLGALGNKEVSRASNVLFDEDEQKWKVVVNLPDGRKQDLPDMFTRRGDAIEYEKQFLNGYIENANVEDLFASYRLERFEASQAEPCTP